MASDTKPPFSIAIHPTLTALPPLFLRSKLWNAWAAFSRACFQLRPAIHLCTSVRSGTPSPLTIRFTLWQVAWILRSNVWDNLNLLTQFMVSHLLVELVWLTWVLIFLLSSEICLGWRKFGISSWAIKQYGTPNVYSTQVHKQMELEVPADEQL